MTDFTPEQLNKTINDSLNQRERDNLNQPSPIPFHRHTGVDSPLINITFQTVSVANATVAPTDTPQNGTIRFLYDGTNYVQWVRINNIWKSIGSYTLTSAKIISALGYTPLANTAAAVETALTFTPENVANKVTSVSGSSTDTQYPSAKLLYSSLTNVYLGLQSLVSGANTITAGYQSAWRYVVLEVTATFTGFSYTAEITIFKTGRTSGSSSQAVANILAFGFTASYSGTTITLGVSGLSTGVIADAYYYQ